MSVFQEQLARCLAAFQVSTAALQTMAQAFAADMQAGLQGSPRSLAMLPSYLSTPTGREQGCFAALDFGGTNVRVLLTELHGDGTLHIQNRLTRSLRDPAAGYDHIGPAATATALFDFIAAQLGELLPPGPAYALGHTFSFPIQQTGLNRGTLMYWTKEFETQGVVGQEINELLGAALKRCGRGDIQPVALLNDTVGTLLAAAYSDVHCDIAAICGTGHNTAYLEPHHPATGKPMIINLESGCFNGVPRNDLDLQLDAASESPGISHLEKMVSGRYVGELARLACLRLLPYGLLAGSPAAMYLNGSDCLDGATLALWAADAAPRYVGIRRWLTEHCATIDPLAADCAALQAIAQAVLTRSARLAAASFAGILQHIDPELTRPHTIAVDGSLYEKAPGYAAALQSTLQELLGSKAAQVTTRLVKDGSGVGAAIASAVAVRS